MAKIVVNGTSLEYAERGKGRAVVFVHGGISDYRTWTGQQGAFSSKYRAITYSRRFHWPNEPIPEGADDQVMPHVEDLKGLLQALNAHPAHLVGNSVGAFTCLLTALHYPELTQSLVLEEPPVLPLFMGAPQRPRTLLKHLLRRPGTTIALMRMGAGTVGPATKAFKQGDMEKGLIAFAHGVYGRELYEGYAETRKQAMRDNIKPLGAGLLGKGFPPLSDTDVRRIKVPVLLVDGERSPPFLQRLTDRLEELFPNVQRAYIPNASHHAHEDNPPAYNEIVLNFLAKAQ